MHSLRTVLRLPAIVLERRTASRLRAAHGFLQWHVTAGWHARGYKRLAAELAQSVDADAYVEIGCGLGDIISHIVSQHRVGIDRDPAVIAGATQAHPSVTFRVADLSSVPDPIVLGTDDCRAVCLIAVNWTDQIPAAELVPALHSAINRLHAKWLVIDRILPSIPTYPWHHSAETLGKLGKVLVDRKGDDVRNLMLIETA